MRYMACDGCGQIKDRDLMDTLEDEFSNKKLCKKCMKEKLSESKESSGIVSIAIMELFLRLVISVPILYLMILNKIDGIYLAIFSLLFILWSILGLVTSLELEIKIDKVKKLCVQKKKSKRKKNPK